MSEQHRNKLDNSEYAQSNTTRDVAPAAVDKSEETRLYEYMRALKLRAEIEAADNLEVKTPMKVWNAAADGGKGAWVENANKKVKVRDLLPVDSEFEKHRKQIIIRLNKLGPDSETFRKWASRFGTNSTFELSSRMANFVLDETRRRSTYEDIRGDALGA